MLFAGLMAGMSACAAVNWPIGTTAEAVKGVWMDNFADATNLAFTTKTPMVLFWANTGCEYCEELEKAINSPTFTAWRKSHSEYIYNFVYAAGGKDLPPNSNSGAKVFAQTAGGTMSALNYYPFVCLYWPKADGTVLLTRLLGRAGYLDNAAYRAGESLADEFAACIEKHFAGYDPTPLPPAYTGGDLAFTAEYDNARLEAEVGYTTSVEMPLARNPEAIGYTGTNTVKCIHVGKTILDRTVIWEAGQANTAIEIPIPSDAATGENITISLYDTAGNLRGTVNLYLVAPKENSPKNPLFIGERTADSLRYGEWTMDLDIAMAKYRANAGSRLLALVGGSLWCPDCVMMDAHLLDRAEFKDWATANKVILVDIDIPNLPNTTNSPSLLTRVVSRVSDGYISGRGTLEPDETQRRQSGAGYLSRHMVSETAALEVIARNRRLVGQNTLNGGWNSPDRANQNRTGVPIFIALRRDGTLAGRIDTFSSVAPSEFKAAHLNRLDELLAAVEDDSESNEESNASWQTTSETFSGTGTSAMATLSAVDLVDTYALAAVDGGAAMQTVAVQGPDAGATVTVSILQVKDGGVTTLATSTGRLSDGVSASGVIAARSKCYVQVSGEASGTFAIDSAAANTKAAYTLFGTQTPIDNPYSNSWISKAMTTMLPLYGADGGLDNALAGTLTLTFKKTKAIVAKYSDGRRVLASFTGKWNAEDISVDGTATVTLMKKEYDLALLLKADGTMTAAVSDGERVLSSGECGLAERYGDFAGTYIVALPCTDMSDAVASAGCSFMTLKMTSSSAMNSGRFTYTVYLADGKKLSGTTYVTVLDANFGVVPVLNVSGLSTFAAAVKVRRDAGNAASPRAVVAMDGSVARWSGSDEVQTFTRRLGAYGSYYDKNRSLVEQSGVAVLEWAVDPGAFSASKAYGALVSVAGAGAKLKVEGRKISSVGRTKGFTFSFNRATGIFKGTTSLAFEKKSKVSATYTGIILPGWFTECDCGEDDDTLIQLEALPFGLGHCVFSDKVNRKTVKRSFVVGLETSGE